MGDFMISIALLVESKPLNGSWKAWTSVVRSVSRSMEVTLSMLIVNLCSLCPWHHANCAQVKTSDAFQ